MRKRSGEGIGKSIHESEVEAAKNALKANAGEQYARKLKFFF